MKKVVLLLMAVVALILSSCNKETDKTIDDLSISKTETVDNAVYVTPYDKRYHQSDCSTISGPRHHITEMSRSEAERSGRTPCMRCNP